MVIYWLVINNLTVSISLYQTYSDIYEFFCLFAGQSVVGRMEFPVMLMLNTRKGFYWTNTKKG